MTMVSHDCVVARARAEYQRAFALEAVVLMLRYGLSGKKAREFVGVMPKVVAARERLMSAEAQCPSHL